MIKPSPIVDNSCKDYLQELRMKEISIPRPEKQINFELLFDPNNIDYNYIFRTFFEAYSNQDAIGLATACETTCHVVEVVSLFSTM